MSNSHYWTSLWVLGLFILLSLFCLNMGSSVLAVLYDRISTFELWNSQVWLRLKVPLIVLGVIGFLAAVIAFIRYQGQRELKVAQDYAHTQGWGFSRDASEGFMDDVSKILSEYKFNLYYIRTVETGRRNLYLFNLCYNSREASGRKNWIYGTACLVQSDRFNSIVASVEIDVRDWTEVMFSDKVEMGESPFTQNFLVQSKDPGSAKSVVNKAIQATLMEHFSNPRTYPVNVIIGPRGLVVLTGRTAEPQRLHEILELARKLESSMS
jgi:hypothetical protein